MSTGKWVFVNGAFVRRELVEQVPKLPKVLKTAECCDNEEKVPRRRKCREPKIIIKTCGTCNHLVYSYVMKLRHISGMCSNYAELGVANHHVADEPADDCPGWRQRLASKLKKDEAYASEMRAFFANYRGPAGRKRR